MWELMSLKQRKMAFFLQWHKLCLNCKDSEIQDNYHLIIIIIIIKFNEEPDTMHM